MQKLKVCLLVLCLCGVANAYLETFDSGSDGWTYGYGTGFTPGTTTWNSAGGNPGAYISGLSNNLYAIWTYDTGVYGDVTGLTMTIDTKVTDQESGTAQFYIGRAGTYYVDGTWNISADTSWATHTTVVNAANFSPWTGGPNGSATLAYVMAAPDDVGIFFGGMVASGSGTLDTDNFGFVPEPATLSLLGLGGLLLRKRK